MVADDTRDGRLTYTHRLAPGVTRVMLYGLRLAQNTCLPESVLQRAKEICHNLEEHKLAQPDYYEDKTEAEEDQEYIEELLGLIENNKFDLNEVKKVQTKLKLRYMSENNQDPSSVIPCNINNETENDDNSDGNEYFDHTTSRNDQFTNIEGENTPSRIENISYLNTENPKNSTETHLSPIHHGEQNSIMSKGTSSATSSYKNTNTSPYRNVRITPVISTRQSTPSSATKNQSQHLEVLPQTPLRSKPGENTVGMSSRNSNQYADKGFESFNFQQNQHAADVPEISNLLLPVVPYSFSQSSCRHSNGALSQHSHQSDITNNARETNYNPFMPNSPMSGPAQSSSKHNDFGKNVRTQMQKKRLVEKSCYEISTSLLSGENEEEWSEPNRNVSNPSCRDNSNPNNEYSPLLTPLTSTPARFSESRQIWSGSHSSMVFHLSPDFKRISRTIDNTNMDCDDEDDF